MYQTLMNRTNTAQGRYITYNFLYLYRCDNHYVIPAVTPEDKGKLILEFEQERGFEHKMFKDEREDNNRDRAFD